MYVHLLHGIILYFYYLLIRRKKNLKTYADKPFGYFVLFSNLQKTHTFYNTNVNKLEQEMHTILNN